MINLNYIGISSDGLVKVIKINYHIDDTVTYQFLNNKPKTVKIYYGENSYFKVGRVKYYFNEIMRIG